MPGVSVSSLTEKNYPGDNLILGNPETNMQEPLIRSLRGFISIIAQATWEMKLQPRTSRPDGPSNGERGVAYIGKFPCMGSHPDPPCKTGVKASGQCPVLSG